MAIPRHTTNMKIDRIHLTASGVNKYPAKQHAQAVARKLETSDGLIYLLGQYAFEIEDSDASKTWRQRRYFYYCSGVDVPDCCLTYDIKHDHLVLYIPEIHPDRVVWVGRGPTIEEAYDRYDVDTVRLNGQLFSDLDYWKVHNPNSTFYILHDDQRPEGKEFPEVDSKKLQHAIDLCRTIKDSHEIALLRQAQEVARIAHTAVLKNILRFKQESQIEGLFTYALISNLSKPAYPVIAGSGENAGVLHYTQNNEPLKGRQLVCMDAGGEVGLYSSDVTRTFPLGEDWPTKEARDIYKLVENIQETLIPMLKPGVQLIDLHILTLKMVGEGLLKLGILHNATPEELYGAGTAKGFYPHGIGHQLGLEVHDTLGVPILKYKPDAVLAGKRMVGAVFPKDQPKLQENMVITIEPGIYFSRYELERAYLSSSVHSKYINRKVLDKYWAVGGVRIEDDLLITADGYENLTTAPKGEAALKIIREGRHNSTGLFDDL